MRFGGRLTFAALESVELDRLLVLKRQNKLIKYVNTFKKVEINLFNTNFDKPNERNYMRNFPATKAEVSKAGVVLQNAANFLRVFVVQIASLKAQMF